MVPAIVVALMPWPDAAGAAPPARERQYATQRVVAPAPRARAQEPRKAEEPKPAGPFLIVVSLSSQKLWLYNGNGLIAESRVSTGQSGYATPAGVYSILQKARMHHSNIYSGAPMPFMQRITWSGIALHAGVVPGYPASHGCIRLPAEFAPFIYGLTPIGTRVIVSHRDLGPEEIEHQNLPQPPLEEPLPPRLVSQAELSLAADMLATPETVQLVVEPVVEPPPRPEPASIFISRKEGKLFVRQGFRPIFDAPVTIRDPATPLGTHVFTAIEASSDGRHLSWIGVTLETAPEIVRTRGDQPPQRSVRRGRGEPPPVLTPAIVRQPSDASGALDRIEIAPEVLERVSLLLKAGSSFIVSDQGLGRETGKGTDFVVQPPTR